MTDKEQIMNYDDYFKLKNYLNKVLDKIYKKIDNIENFIKETGGTQRAKVELAHIEELECELEEAVNMCDWFLEIE